MDSPMPDKRYFIFPAIFVAVLVPVFIVALLTYRPNDDCDCQAAAAAPLPHSHGVGLVTATQDDMQLIMNVSPGAELYQLNEEGRLELCSDLSDENMKHVTVDVIDARLNPGERLPVTVSLEVRRADTGAIVIDERDAPAMYAPGHGYHFGDNFLLDNDVTYDWTAIISPVEALRQAGAEDMWLEPVTWSGQFTLDAEGNVAGKAAALQLLGDFTDEGLHVTLSHEAGPVALYAVADGQTVAQDADPDSRYFVVDVTDHAVNYEEKLPGADVTLVFQQGSTRLEQRAEPVISPMYGFHYGANVALAAGEWEVTVTVDGLPFLRHAGSAVGLGRSAISASFPLTLAG